MKLFTPTKAKIENTKRKEEDISQIAYLTITLRKLQDSINKENKNFEDRMREQRDLYTTEKIKLQDQLKELESKIAQRERRLVQLLIPVDGLKERAEELLERSQTQAISLLTREEELANKEKVLEEKNTNLTEREVSLSENEIKIEARLKSVEDETKIISQNHKKLNDQIKVFESSRDSKLKELQEKENSLKIREQRATDYLNTRTKELNEMERALIDKRKALDRAFSELERLKKK